MRAVNNEEQVEELQNDLDTIYNWQEKNKMLFNAKKFELMRYGPNEELKHSTNYLSHNYEEIIEVKETLRDLGVIMSVKATFTEHIKHVCSKVKQKSGWIL